MGMNIFLHDVENFVTDEMMADDLRDK